MENRARQYYRIEPVFQEYGTILSENNDVFSVETESGRWEAKRAVSCLIQPAVGDRVLLSVNSASEFFILAILERHQDDAYHVLFDQSVQISTKKGSLSFTAQDGLTLAASRNIDLVSSEFNLRATKGDIDFENLVCSGNFLQIQWNRIKVFAKICDSVMERISQRVKRSFRTIEETEQIKAERLDYTADGLLSLRGKYSVMTAKKDVKIDGEHIHMG